MWLRAQCSFAVRCARAPAPCFPLLACWPGSNTAATPCTRAARPWVMAATWAAVQVPASTGWLPVSLVSPGPTGLGAECDDCHCHACRVGQVMMPGGVRGSGTAHPPGWRWGYMAQPRPDHSLGHSLACFQLASRGGRPTCMAHPRGCPAGVRGWGLGSERVLPVTWARGRCC